MAQEKNFENKVKQFLKERGCYFIKYWGGGEFTKAGIPDILCCCCGYFFGIEVKAKNGKPTPLQIHNLKMIDKAGGFGILLYPQDFELFRLLIIDVDVGDYSDAKRMYQKLKERWLDG